MEQNDKNKAWWQPAIVMFARVSVWVAVPIILALFIGKYLDKRYGTDPWIFIGSTIVAFIISMIAIAKISMDYIKKMDKDLPAQAEKKDGESNQSK